MPVKVAPRPKESPRNAVKTFGNQQMFQAAGSELASKLGWEGEPDHEGNGIRVEDAWNFIVKTLHENFIAGALGHDLPNHLAACEHLGLTEQVDIGAMEQATRAAFEAGGKGDVEAVEVEGRTVSAGAAMVMTGKVG